MLVGPGSTLASRYRLVRLLGRGGMAEVYEANDGRLGRRVAVKVFRGETDIATSQARQQLEIQALARLQHPNIVGVFDAGTDAGVSFVVMQLIDGVTLAERTRGSALAPAETARVGRAVADALAHVHSFGMVHRDIKPGNILCGVNGHRLPHRLRHRPAHRQDAADAARHPSAPSPISRQNRYAGRMSGPRRISMPSGSCCSSA